MEEKKFDIHPDKGAVVFDGIIDEQNFSGILYLLKEATKKFEEKYKSSFNDYPEEFLFMSGKKTWDFAATTKRTVIHPEERVGSVWPVLCRWTRTYFNGRSLEENKAEIARNGYYDKADYSDLLKVAIVNIKKTAGESTCNEKELSAAVKEYGDLIIDEVELISPRIVICGNTYDFAKKIFNVKEESFLYCGAAYFNYKDMIFVDFPHPSARWNAKKLKYVEPAILELRQLFKQTQK